MDQERLTLHPDIPLSWEEPETIRFGFDRVVARLVEPSPGVQHLLARLRDGVKSGELALLAKGFGVTEAQLHELLRTLDPVLQRDIMATPERERTHTPERTLVVIGNNEAAEQIRAHCASLNFRPPAQGSTAGMAILVDHFWGATAHSQALLRDQIPHLIVRFTDRAFLVGPILLPGGELCQNCIELHALEADPQLRLVAAQLAAHTPPALSSAAMSYAITMSFTALRNWQQGATELLNHRLRVPVRNGIPSLMPKRERLRAHRNCACLELAAAQRPLGLATEFETGLFDKSRGQPL